MHDQSSVFRQSPDSLVGFLDKSILILLLCGLAVSCQAPERGVVAETFGKTPAGDEVQIYTLTNNNGMEARITDYGAIVVSLKVPDRDGQFDDVVLGFDSLDGYVGEHPYFGAIVGRYGNRIAKGEFTLDGNTYTLAKNNGPNHLHGGVKGFDKQVWSAEPLSSDEGPALVLRHRSPDGDEGYPGTLDVQATYTLRHDNALQIDYEARTDKPTVLNLTSHSYFNLGNAGASSITGHEMMLNADRFTPVDSTLIPTGELRAVEATPMDFRQRRTINARMLAMDEQLEFGGGYDHNWVLNRSGSGLSLAAQVYESTTGRVMEVLTTEPGVQFYTGNFLDGTIVGKGGVRYEQRAGLCLETQHFPDSPNQQDFPSAVLRPGETYESTTVYRFSVAN